MLLSEVGVNYRLVETKKVEQEPEIGFKRFYYHRIRISNLTGQPNVSRGCVDIFGSNPEKDFLRLITRWSRDEWYYSPCK